MIILSNMLINAGVFFFLLQYRHFHNFKSEKLSSNCKFTTHSQMNLLIESNMCKVVSSESKVTVCDVISNIALRNRPGASLTVDLDQTCVRQQES